MVFGGRVPCLPNSRVGNPNLVRALLLGRRGVCRRDAAASASRLGPLPLGLAVGAKEVAAAACDVALAARAGARRVLARPTSVITTPAA